MIEETETSLCILEDHATANAGSSEVALVVRVFIILFITVLQAWEHLQSY